MIRDAEHARQLVRAHVMQHKPGLPKAVKRWLPRQTRYEYVAGSKVAVTCKATETDAYWLGLYGKEPLQEETP